MTPCHTTIGTELGLRITGRIQRLRIGFYLGHASAVF